MSQLVRLAYHVRRMEPRDIPSVLPLDRLVFKDPWPESAYVQELYFNPDARYFILQIEGVSGQTARWPWKVRRAHPVQGFVGMRVEKGQAHISTLAVHPDWRGYGLGELLLITALEQAVMMKAASVILEVRVSNFVARRLYEKYGFAPVSCLRGYYHDGEDAELLEVDLDEHPDYAAMLQERRRELEMVLLGS